MTFVYMFDAHFCPFCQCVSAQLLITFLNKEGLPKSPRDQRDRVGVALVNIMADAKLVLTCSLQFRAGDATKDLLDDQHLPFIA